MNELKEKLNGLNDAAKIIYQNNVDKGFWEDERNIGECLMLVVTELAEALEAHREGNFCNENALTCWEYWQESTPNSANLYFEKNIKDKFCDELSDSFIRLLDLCGHLDIDIEGHINAKVEYNKSRPYKHGKKY